MKSLRQLSEELESLNEGFTSMPIVPLGTVRKPISQELPDMDFGIESKDNVQESMEIKLPPIDGMSDKQIVEMVTDMCSAKAHALTSSKMNEQMVRTCMSEYLESMCEDVGKYSSGRYLIISPIDEDDSNPYMVFSEANEEFFNELQGLVEYVLADEVSHISVRVPHGDYRSVMKLANHYDMAVKG